METAQRVPILVYHHVYPEEAPELKQASFETGAGIIGVATFRRQLQRIAETGWHVVSTSRLVDWLNGAADLPARALALHFDNGWLDTRTVALPLLREFGFAGTCFPITDGVEGASDGRTTEVRTLTEGHIVRPFMNWVQVRELLDAGWEIGAHTASHGKLAELHAAGGDEAVVRETDRAHAVFAERLGFVPCHFAYPSGSRTERTDALLSPYYRSLRLWHFEWPIRWTFTDRSTSPAALDCQNIDLRVPWEAFELLLEQTPGPA